MRLADRIAQCRTPLVVEHTIDGSVTELSGPAAYAQFIADCATRYVLSDDLARLCTALAYSKGADRLACADLLHVPAHRVWVEWAVAPWQNELALYAFPTPRDSARVGRGGVYIQSTAQGRRGLLRAFWAHGDTEMDVLASSMEAYFDFDTPEGKDPEIFDQQLRSSVRVVDGALGDADILRRCFRFRFERSWQEYYERARLTPPQFAAVTHRSLGSIAICIPVLLAFFLLLVTRPGLPRRPLMLERLNRARIEAGKPSLLEHIEVFAPLLPEYRANWDRRANGPCRVRRLHHVRGHLVRRGGKLFWRVPHLRGSARAGTIRARTVTWHVEPPTSSGRSADAAMDSQAQLS